MTTILRIDASARTQRSLTRMLGDRFGKNWKAQRPEDQVIFRDVGISPPPAISEEWIDAAHTPEEQRSATEQEVVALSDTLIDELERADIVLIATPMYNYGMPASLKAWVDQVVRIDKTFTFDLARGDYPLEPVMSGKTMVLLTTSGEFGFAPGGVRQNMNHLDPHLRAFRHYLGVDEIHQIAIEYQEFGDDRHRASIEAALAAIPILIDLIIAKAASDSEINSAT